MEEWFVSLRDEYIQRLNEILAQLSPVIKANLPTKAINVDPNTIETMRRKNRKRKDPPIESIAHSSGTDPKSSLTTESDPLRGPLG